MDFGNVAAALTRRAFQASGCPPLSPEKIIDPCKNN
jgi:hypothetical protein